MAQAARVRESTTKCEVGRFHALIHGALKGVIREGRLRFL